MRSVIDDKTSIAISPATFFLPIVFFSIFAGVFGSQGRDATPRVRVAVVDEDHSPASERLIAALKKEGGLTVQTAARPPGAGLEEKGPQRILDRERATQLVKDGTVPVAIVIPSGFGARFGIFDGSAPPIDLLADTSDPVAPHVVSGLLQKSALSGASSSPAVPTAAIAATPCPDASVVIDAIASMVRSIASGSSRPDSARP